MIPALKDRLQPALLDRLVDAAPDQDHEPASARVLSRQQLREAVLRDLGWLFNTTRLGGQSTFGRCDAAQRAVLNYGLPALAGATITTVDTLALEQAIRQAILDYEPRILAASLQVQAQLSDDLLEQHNIVRIRIRGLLWAQPVPVELLLRTDLDLETGVVELRDLGSSG
jgi:type VI secretion system protein ImpF